MRQWSFFHPGAQIQRAHTWLGAGGDPCRGRGSTGAGDALVEIGNGFSRKPKTTSLGFRLNPRRIGQIGRVDNRCDL